MHCSVCGLSSNSGLHIKTLQTNLLQIHTQLFYAELQFGMLYALAHHNFTVQKAATRYSGFFAKNADLLRLNGVEKPVSIEGSWCAGSGATGTLDV